MAYTLGVLVTSVPKIFVNGQFYFILSLKMWSHVFWNTVYTCIVYFIVFCQWRNKRWWLLL